MERMMFFSILKKIRKVPKNDVLTQIKQTLNLISELPLLDALKQSTDLMVSLSEDKSQSYEAHLACLHEIEAVNEVKLLQLSADLFSKRGIDRDLLNKAESVVGPYCKRLFLEMVLMAEKMHAELGHGQATQQAFAKHLCLTLNAGLNIIKWRYYDDQPAPTVTWSNLHRLYQFAENSSVLYTRVQLDEQVTNKVDFASLYITAAMLNTLHLGNFTAREIQIASKLMPVWLQGVAIEKVFLTERHQYFVDLQGAQGADRVRSIKAIANGRYWKTSDVVNRIEAYVDAIREHTLPNSSSILAHGSVDVLYRMFKKLAQEWSVTHYKRQRRRVSRLSADKKIFATFGLAQICEYLTLYDKSHSYAIKNNIPEDTKKSTEELTLVERTLASKQSLHIVDESYNGFGVNLGDSPIGYMQAGNLIGFWHPSIANQYVVAEIKSVRKQKNGQYRAGLQIISSQSILIKLNKIERNAVELSQGFYLDDGELANVDDSPKLNCLLIPAKDGLGSAPPSLIIASDEYKQHRHFSFLTNGSERTVEIGLPLAKQSDWVRASIVAIQ